MSVADLFVIAIVAVLLGFIVWANVHHRRHGGRARDAGVIPDPADRGRGGG